jgi:hypothetical protein
LEEAAKYYEFASNKSGNLTEDHQFRCLRGLNRASLSDLQFSDLSSVRLKVFTECQSARPVRSGMMYDYVTTRDSSAVTTVLGHGGSSTVVLGKGTRLFFLLGISSMFLFLHPAFIIFAILLLL